MVDFPFNASEKAKGEPWTREDPANLTKSVLDLVIISQELYQYVDEFSIDNQKKITPFKVGKNCSLSFTDHYTITIKFKGIPLKSSPRNSNRNYSKWNYNKPGGWDAYKALTSSNSKLKAVADSPSEDPDAIMNEITYA